MAKNNRLLAGLSPVHPGAVLREDVLPYVKMSKTDIAEALGVSRAQLYAILGEDAPVTAAMALRLGKLFGNGPEVWLGAGGDPACRSRLSSPDGKSPSPIRALATPSGR